MNPICFIDRLAGGRYHAQLEIQSPRLSHPGAGVAQLVEQRFRKPQVARSIRVAGSTQYLVPSQRSFFVVSSLTSVDKRLPWFSFLSEMICRCRG